MPLGCAEARFQPVSVDDVAKAFAAALDTPAMAGQTYDLCGPAVYTLKALVEYTASVIDVKRRIVPLSENLAYFQAALLSMLPNKLMSADNVRSMEIDSVCNGACKIPPNWNPEPLEAVAPLYLLGSGDTAQLDDYRSRAGR
jgi:NADH dehydrogenase